MPTELDNTPRNSSKVSARTSVVSDDETAAVAADCLPRASPGDGHTGPNKCSPHRLSTLLILGAGGYVGREVARYFHRRPGWRVIGVFHRPPSHAWCDESAVRDICAQDLTDLIPAVGRVVLLNAAFDFSAVGRVDPQRRYRFVEAVARDLMERPGCTCINISSMAAFAGCRSDYGREKLFVEDLFSQYRGVNVRPGLIASWDRPGSAFLHLVRIVQGSLVVPYLTAKGEGFFMCDLDTMIAGIDAIIGMKLNKPHTVSFCYFNRMRLKDVLRAIQTRLGIPRLLVPVPWRLGYCIIAAKECVFGRGKVRADSILEFAFSATSATRRHLFARIVKQWRSDGCGGRVSGITARDFSFLEVSLPAQASTRNVD